MKSSKYAFLLFTMCMAFNSVHAQRNPSSKEFNKLLIGKWKIKLLYYPDYDRIDDQYQYFPIDNKNINKFVWIEETFDESRYSGFGLETIDFLANGKFEGKQHDYRQMELLY